MVGGKNVVQVLDRSAFHDTQLVCSGDLSYLGGSWSKTAGSAVSLLLHSLPFPDFTDISIFKKYNSCFCLNL